MWKLQEEILDFKDKQFLAEFIVNTERFTQFEKVKDFERLWSLWQNTKYSTYLNSGSSADLVMLDAVKEFYKIEDDAEVLVPAVTWITNITSVIQSKMTPVFVDINLNDLSFDYDKLENSITSKTRIILITHLIGIPANIDKIKEIADKYNLIILEDCCEAHGAKYGSEKVGNFGVASTFSFYWGHHMSVSPNTPIPYLDEYNNFNLDSIENIYNKYNENINKIKIITFDRDEYNTYYKNPSKILKHKFNDKKIFRLKLINGREVDITEDHSVFSYDKFNFDIIEKQGSNINIGDYIIVPSKISRPKIKNELNFLEYCKTIKDKFFVVNYNVEEVDNIRFKWNSKENKQKFNWKKRGVLPLEYIKGELCEELKIAVKNTPKYKYLPIKYKIDNDICRLIGYFLAEGSYKKSGINFSFHINESEYISDVQNIIFKIFNIETRLVIDEENKSCTILANSETLLIFFREFLNIKSGAMNKQIPKFIFESSDICIGSFLYGYFAGDGTKFGKRISVTSVSKKMINELSYLFNMLGINGSVIISEPSKKEYCIKNKIVKNKKTQYKLQVYNIILDKTGYIKYTENFLNKKLIFPIEKYNKRKKSNVNYKCVDYIKYFNNDFLLNDKLNKFVNSDLTMLKVKNIEIIKPDYEYVYDFSVPNTENFVGGWQPICLHNTTVEGGMICTNIEELNDLFILKRSHGLARELNSSKHEYYKNKFPDIDFNFLFLTHGYNFRNTELNAVVGIHQIKYLDGYIDIRNENHKKYLKIINNISHKVYIIDNEGISSFCLPFIFKEISDKVKFKEVLRIAEIEIRPIIGGNLLHQPCFSKYGNPEDFKNAQIIHNNGFYIGNNQFVNDERLEMLNELILKTF